MYSLLCKSLKVGQFSNLVDSSDSREQKFRNPAQAGTGSTFADKAAGLVKRSRGIQQLLLLLAVLGTSMTIGDGVMTACASGDCSGRVVVATFVYCFCLGWGSASLFLLAMGPASPSGQGNDSLCFGLHGGKQLSASM